MVIGIVLTICAVLMVICAVLVIIDTLRDSHEFRKADAIRRALMQEIIRSEIESRASTLAALGNNFCVEDGELQKRIKELYRQAAKRPSGKG